MKMFLLISILIISNALFASSKGCKVNVEFNSLMGSKRQGIERLIRRTLKDKGYQVRKRNFLYPDYSFTLSQGSVCYQPTEGTSVFQEVVPQVVDGSFVNLSTGDAIDVTGWGESKIIGEIIGLGLRRAIKDAFVEFPNCNKL